MSDRLTESELANMDSLLSNSGGYVGVADDRLQILIATARRESAQAEELARVKGERDAMAKVVEAAKYMPRRTPKGGSASDDCVYTIPNGVVWSLDTALAALNSPVTAPNCQEAVVLLDNCRNPGRKHEGCELGECHLCCAIEVAQQVLKDQKSRINQLETQINCIAPRRSHDQ